MRDNDLPTTKPLIDATQLVAALEQFAADRKWSQFHSPKNLVMALTGEVGELSEVFQWMSEADSQHAATNPETEQAVKDEIADVLLYLVRLADVLKVDLNESVTQKLKTNALKYPLANSLGVSTKYNIK
jgi:NTP pyrophosphatase (non-canonical NTP hydrolase)